MNTYPLHIDEAQRIVLASITQTTDFIQVGLMESGGYVLAENIVAEFDIPQFDRSMMDGFVVRFEDTLLASLERPISLWVVAEIPAGVAPLAKIGAGEAARIMTGGMIPHGANAVCRFEATKDGFQIDVPVARILSPLEQGQDIAHQGEDIRRGEIVLTKGSRIGAAEIAVLASFGKSRVTVYRKPIVAILSTGSELVAVDESLRPGKIHNSNSYMIAVLIREAGGEPLILNATADDVSLLTAEVAAVIDKIDMLVTTGGVSVGDYDVIPDVYKKLGATTQFWKVLLRPGSPFRFALRDKTPFFGVSGNPAASFVNTQLFVLPALRKLSGQLELTVLPRMSKARLTNVLPTPEMTQVKQTRFLRASAYLAEGQLHVTIASGQSSGMISSLVGANCLLRLDGGKKLTADSLVDILLFDEVQMQ